MDQCRTWLLTWIGCYLFLLYRNVVLVQKTILNFTRVWKMAHLTITLDCSDCRDFRLVRPWSDRTLNEAEWQLILHQWNPIISYTNLISILRIYYIHVYIDSIFVPWASGSQVFYCDKYDQSKTWILQNVYKPQLGEITDYKIIFAKNIRQLTLKNNHDIACRFIPPSPHFPWCFPCFHFHLL